MSRRPTNFFSRFVTAMRSTPQVVANAVRTRVMSLTMQVHIASANLWREMFNPLRGLTMGRAVCYLEEGERGAYADLQWLYRYIEKRDATLRGGKRSLLGAIAEMDWEIKVVDKDRLPAGYTEADAEAQAITLRTRYDGIGNLSDAIEFLGLAEFRGYSHLEKVYNESGNLVELMPVPQWHWVREGLSGPWQYNADARQGTTRGEEVDLNRFVIREIDDPIDEVALIAFVRKQLGRKDEDAFIESFGVPSIFAIMPQNVPAGRESEYQDLAEQVISDSRGSLPHGSDIKALDAGARGVAPFRQYQDALDKEIVMAITSGALTMLAESGSGTLAGGAHSETFMRVARSLARRITTVLQRQLDLEFLAAAHPGQPPLAYFEILSNQEIDSGEIIKDVRGLEAAGFAVDVGQVSERAGWNVTRKPAANAVSSAPALPALPNRTTMALPAGMEHEELDDEFAGEAVALLREAGASDSRAIADRLQALLAQDLSDADLMTGLEQLRADLPGLAAELASSEAMVAAWETILGAAAGNGLAVKKKVKA